MELEDGGTYRHNALQRWMWERFLDSAERVKQIHQEWGGSAFHVVHVGDIVDGDHHNTWQIIGREPSAQKTAARAGMRAYLDLLPAMDSIRFCRGTPSHAGRAHSSEESVVRSLEQDGYPIVVADENRHCHYRARFKTETGHRVDALHHDSAGAHRPWTRQASGSRLAEIIFSSYAQANPEAPQAPHVAMRGHTHFFKDSGLGTPVRAIVTPGWQAKSDWVHQIAPEESPTVGVVVWLLEEGKVPRVERVDYQPMFREDPWKTSASLLSSKSSRKSKKKPTKPTKGS